MIEIWKPIPNHPGYEASSLGRIRSIDRVTVFKYRDGTRSRNMKGRILALYAPKQERKQYFRVTLTDDVTLKVHRVICETFHGPAPEGKPWALHRDDDFSNNREDNLYWGDRDENGADRRRNGKKPT